VWTLIATPADWDAYRRRKADEAGVRWEAVVWGSGPVEYPALVATLIPRPIETGSRFLSAYVYPADARTLLAAAQAPVAPPNATNPTQAQFNRWVSAQLLAITYFLTETGICTRGRYEDQLLQALETVDARLKGDAAEHLSQSQRDGLDMLGGRG